MDPEQKQSVCRQTDPIVLLISRAVATLATSLLCLSWAAASETNATENTASPTGFRPYEDSFVIYNQMRNNGWTASDERALRAHFSFKYSFCGPRLDRSGKREPETNYSLSLCPSWAKLSDAEVFVAYTGEFDFYMGTRDSGPVINRLSAPGIYLRFPFKSYPSLGNNWDEVDSLEIGYEHRSNGQVTDVNSDRGTEIAHAAYAAKNRAYFDTISRGANYLTATLDRRVPLDREHVDLRAKLRFPIGTQDSNITWGPLADSAHRFSSYDRLELRLSRKVFRYHRAELQWRIGDKGLATDSWTLGFLLNLGELPVYFRYHRGPFNTLSNYAQRQDSFGVGLLLSRF